MGGNAVTLPGSSTLSSSGTFYTLDQCYSLCYENTECLYFIWTHGTTTGSQCESPWDNGQYTYGWRYNTFMGLCAMYGVYQNLNWAYVYIELQCRDDTYQHFRKL